jgi:hypothetical protein
LRLGVMTVMRGLLMACLMVGDHAQNLPAARTGQPPTFFSSTLPQGELTSETE